MLTPQQIVDIWARNTAQARDKFTAGVEGVQEAPGKRAAQQADYWEQRTIAAKKKFATNVGKVTLQEWKDAMLKTGLARIASGVEKGKPKMERYMIQAVPVYEQIKKVVKAMPKTTEADADARMLKAVQMMREFGRTRRGG